VSGHAALSALGGAGQATLSVVPDLDLVVFVTCQSPQPRRMDMLERFVLPATETHGIHDKGERQVRHLFRSVTSRRRPPSSSC
jgi:hypothetical protein